MSENSLSSLSRGILDILSQKKIEDEAMRQSLAINNGLPPDSTWRQISDEARRKTLLDQREIINSLRTYNPELADKLERCFSDGRTMLQYASESPENHLARVAASIFYLDYEDLSHYCATVTDPDRLRGLATDAEEKIKNFIQGLLDTAWDAYTQYGNLQNLFNNTGYTLVR